MVINVWRVLYGHVNHNALIYRPDISVYCDTVPTKTHTMQSGGILSPHEYNNKEGSKALLYSCILTNI